MNKLDELTQIMYELAMTIGSDLNLDRMLRDVALVTLRKLNGTAFIVFEKRQEADRVYFKRVYITPIAFSKSEGYAALEQVLPRPNESHLLESFYSKLPMMSAVESGEYFHLMELPGYGLIAIFRAQNYLPPHVIQSFAALNEKLAIACLACLAHDNLEELVQARTRELEQKNKELDSFTSSVSHDLKTPLRGIDGYSRLLTKQYSDKLDEEGLQFLQNIRISVNRMNQLIEDLLAYARMEKRNIHTTTINVKDLVERLIAERQHDIESNQVQIAMKLAVMSVRADLFMMRQVIGNYLDNAIKFSQKEEHPSVEIDGSENEKAWTLWVKDNGIGFDPKYHDQIFEIFQRLHRVDEYKGTGVGLAIVRKAVERMGGRVWAEGNPGKGSTFFVKILK